jgi:hypothetical protein
MWKELFEQAGLRLVAEKVQLGLPEGLYAVKMYVARSYAHNINCSWQCIGMHCGDHASVWPPDILATQKAKQSRRMALGHQTRHNLACNRKMLSRPAQTT